MKSLIDPDERTDFELLQAWKHGDLAAGNALVERHFESLYRFFRVRVDGDVADLVQRTLAACVARRADFAGKSSFTTFLIGIAPKELLMYLRKMYRGQRAMATYGRELRVAPTSPTGKMALRQQEKLLLQALRSLPDELQVVLALFYWEELSVQDIGAILEVPAGTVKSRLFRARHELRSAILASEASARLIASTLHGLNDWARLLREKLTRESDS